MIRYLCRSYLPYRWMVRRKVFHPSLERLVELADPSLPATAAADEFSRIQQNLRIRGVWKWTGRARLREMDRLLTAYAVGQGWVQLRMLDVGASDGITSLDTVEFLRSEAELRVSLTMVERDTRLMRIGRGRGALYFTPSHRPILVRFGRLAFCLEPMEGYEGLIFNRLAARLAAHFTKVLARADLSAATAISLVNPAVSRCSSIEVCERDLFDPEPRWFGAYDAVRASNVLNFSYHSQTTIRDTIGLAHRYLKDGGALLVSRNVIGEHDETETGALWRKQGAGFLRVSRLETLPDIAALVDEFQLPAPSGPVNPP